VARAGETERDQCRGTRAETKGLLHACGFHNALVAAPSQKAALKAWGTTTDLFAAGRASVVEDPDLQTLALARPGEVVKHSRGDEAAILERIDEEERDRDSRSE
jgi:hypothetical protein